MLEHVSLPEAVTRVLRHRILNNEIPADSRLVEANLAAKFGVSRGTIRDAMRGLQAEGLIDIVPRRYSVVTRMSTEDAEDVCYARYVLEEASISRGLPHYGNELAKELQAAIEAMAAAVQANDLDALVESDTRFHEQLVDASGRHRLKQLWSTLNSQMGAVLRSEIERRGVGPSSAVQSHRAVFDAVIGGDSQQLRAVLREHYLAGFAAWRPESGAGAEPDSR
jgi:DNA-binding GntR family transcriptional regulator